MLLNINTFVCYAHSVLLFIYFSCGRCLSRPTYAGKHRNNRFDSTARKYFIRIVSDNFFFFTFFARILDEDINWLALQVDFGPSLLSRRVRMYAWQSLPIVNHLWMAYNIHEFSICITFDFALFSWRKTPIMLIHTHTSRKKKNHS